MGDALMPARAMPAWRERAVETGEVLIGWVISPQEPLVDSALDLIQEWLRDPEWRADMLEDIARAIERTGHTTENYPDNRPTWNRY